MCSDFTRPPFHSISSKGESILFWSKTVFHCALSCLVLEIPVIKKTLFSEIAYIAKIKRDIKQNTDFLIASTKAVFADNISISQIHVDPE